MRKNIGNTLALYPMPVTVIGAMNGENPTWTLVAHVGILGHDHVLVSLASKHFINGCIKKNKKLSINLVSKDMLPLVDKAGSITGFAKEKSNLFPYEIHDNGIPSILNSPLTMECIVQDIYLTDGFENFICTIDATYVDDRNLDAEEKINYSAMKPVLFDMPNYEYLSTGEKIGKCLSFKKED